MRGIDNHPKKTVGPIRPHRHSTLLVCALAFCATVASSYGLALGEEDETEAAVSPSEERFLDLRIDGKLRPETQRAISRLLESDIVSRIRRLALEKGQSLSELCERVHCPSSVARLLDKARRLAAEEKTAYALPKFETVTEESATYAVIAPAEGTIFEYAERQEEAIAIPLDDPQIDEAIERGQIRKRFDPDPSEAALEIDEAANDKVALIDRDISIVGNSSRQYRLNQGLGDDERRRLLEIIERDSAVTAVRTTARLIEKIFFDHPNPQDVIEFEAGDEACGAASESLPFDSTRVAEIIAFNQEVREKLGLRSIQRSKILVIDTGVSPDLARSAAFRPALYPDPAELFSLNVAYRSHTGQVLECLDRNNNGYRADIYGAGPSSEAPGACESPSFALDQLAPLKVNPNSRQSYLPGHGGFVAGLAAGGPDLLTQFPDISSYVGISVYRATRNPIDPAQSVHADENDLDEGLGYAEEIGADIINLSLKTSVEQPFIGLEGKTDALLVTSAGNSGSSLDGAAQDNLPASFPERAPLRPMMIVVAAVKTAPGHPWWPESQHSDSKVDIAAPGAPLLSFALDGGRLCASGTSGAAAVVSFTAGVLKALGLTQRQAIKARIIASGDHDPDLETRVRLGRRLNVPAALDLFVDRIHVKEGNALRLRRGWIEPDAQTQLLPICAPNNSSDTMRARRGIIDLSKLWSWRRTGGDGARQQMGRFEHRIGYDPGFVSDRCELPPRGFMFYDQETGETEKLSWSEVQAILPSPFRAVKEAVLVR